MIEEVDTLPHEIQAVAYEQARAWLTSSESPDIQPRLRAARKRIAARRQNTRSVNAVEVLFNKRHDLEHEVSKFEHELIAQTLAKVNGKVTHAAKLLGLGYQKLAYHPDGKENNMIRQLSLRLGVFIGALLLLPGFLAPATGQTKPAKSRPRGIPGR